MFILPPAVLAALATIAGLSIVAGAVIKVFGPPIVALLNAHTSEKTAKLIKTVVDDVYIVGSGIAAVTPTALDDTVMALVKQVDEQFQALKGRPMTDGEKSLAKTQVLANHFDPDTTLKLTPAVKGPQP